MFCCLTGAFVRPIRPADLEGMGFFVEPKVCLTGSTSTNALAANPTLAGLEECARLAHKPLRSFIHVCWGQLGAHRCAGAERGRGSSSMDLELSGWESRLGETLCLKRLIFIRGKAWKTHWRCTCCGAVGPPTARLIGRPQIPHNVFSPAGALGTLTKFWRSSVRSIVLTLALAC